MQAAEASTYQNERCLRAIDERTHKPPASSGRKFAVLGTPSGAHWPAKAAEANAAAAALEQESTAIHMSVASIRGVLFFLKSYTGEITCRGKLQ